jgi:hypothetical protein
VAERASGVTLEGLDELRERLPEMEDKTLVDVVKAAATAAGISTNKVQRLRGEVPEQQDARALLQTLNLQVNVAGPGIERFSEDG